MKTLFVGVDVSKGYADFAVMSEEGSLVRNCDRFDDTALGHAAVADLFARLDNPQEPVHFVVGVESSGGLERNWAHFFKSIAQKFNLKVYLLNPLAVKRFLSRDLHRNVNDRISARGIADYLRSGMRTQEASYEPELEGPRTLCRSIRNLSERCAELQNEIQSLLPRVHPELVRFCRNGIPQWILHLLVKYPTVTELSSADPAELNEIPHVGDQRARDIVQSARKSVAAQRDRFTAASIRLLTEQLLQLQKQESQAKKELCENLKNDAGVRIMRSIPGIGLWTAVCLRIEIGPIERFRSAEALIAYAGLDPQIHTSGDGEIRKGISKRGKRQIRALLYTSACCARVHNPVIEQFYVRLLAAGKKKSVALTACMRKILSIVYGCWISEKEFDASYAEQVSRNTGERKTAHPPAAVVVTTLSLDAPVSWKEAKKRKAVLLSQARQSCENAISAPPSNNGFTKSPQKK